MTRASRKKSPSTEHTCPCADLHIHSTYSDGILTPAQIVQASEELNLKIIAITDHDSVSGVEETIRTAQNSIEVIPAAEFSSNIGHLDIHILAYYIDTHNDELLSYLDAFQQHRMRRAKKIVEKLSYDGVKLDFDQIKSSAKNAALGRPHIAEALKENGYVNSISEAFFRYLGYHAPYYEPKKNIHPKQVIQYIKKWEGVPVIAHPNIVAREGLIHQIIEDGAAGIEVWHPEHTESMEQQFRQVAAKYGLLMTGGSDYHGYRGDYDKIGRCGCGEKEVCMLRDYWKNKRSI